MPPKKGKDKEDAPPVIPEVEASVELPAELAEEFPEPSFCLVLGHIFGHQFRIQEPEKEGDEDPPEDGPPIVDFDPCARLVARAKEPEDPLLKSIGIVEREDLQAIATAENISFLAALRNRLQKERAARSVAKSNRAKRRAIEALEAAKAREAEEGDPPADPPVVVALAAAREEPEVKADFFLVLRDYPANEEEIQQLADEGLCAEGLIDLWASVYLAGETLEEPAEEEAEPQEPRIIPCEMPELVRQFYERIVAAPNGSELADCTICTHRESEGLAIAGEDKAQGEHVQAAVSSLVSAEVAAKVRYRDWIKKPTRISIPDISQHERYGESRLYQRMMGSIDPVHHDIPLFLHCLTEQVDRTLGGGAEDQEFTAAFSSLQDYMGAALDGLLSTGGDVPRPPPRVGEVRPAGAEAASAPAASAAAATTPNLDACVHRLGADRRGGSKLEGGEAAAEVVDRLLAEVRVPGANRAGFPKDAVHSPAQLKAVRSRLYPFVPAAPAECEQMALLRAFEQLLERAQPERHWSLTDRHFRELIPREFLARTLAEALREEPFMDSAYLPRLDCLLIALHHRSLPGRVMWHSWKGDLLDDPESDRWEEGLFTVPTYNDWSLAFGAGPTAAPGAPAPQPRQLLEGFDARRAGYAGTVEKLATPADGSVILVTKTRIGLERPFPVPANEYPASMVHNDAFGIEVEGTVIGDGNESAVTGATTAVPDLPGAEATATVKWDAPAARSSRVARVMKDGLVFGIVEDASWKQWCQLQHDEFVREAEAAAAAIAAAAAEADVEGSQRAESKPASASGDPVVQQEVFEPPFQGADLGTLWVAFPSGARCSARMHHERVISQGELPSGAAALAAQSLPPMGVLLTYTMCAGQVVQVFSDGSVRLSWPLALRDGLDASAAAAALVSKDSASATSTLSGSARLPAASDRPHFEPGCPEDIEMSRTVTPFGSLVRRLLSGRVEVRHADGTIATRNPTVEELQRQLGSLRKEKCSAAFAPRLELLARLSQVYAERFARPLAEPPSARAKAAGLPGHWVVVRPDGSVFGRAPTPPPPPPACSPGEDAAGDAASEPAGSPRTDGGGTAAAAAASEPAAPPLHELLGGVLIDGGSAVEYDITPISKALQVDLQSRHKTFKNQSGLASFEDPEGVQRVNVHTDGTQVVRTRSQDGYEVSVSKVPMAHVRCIVNNSPADEGMLVVVECSDGTRIEVVPQMNGAHYADLVPLTPNAEDLLSLSTSASAVLECRSGAKVVSTGSGQVDVFTGPGGGGYTALCHEGRLVLRDEEGSEFELRTDQTLAITESGNGGAVSGSGVLAFPSVVDNSPPQIGNGSPRCMTGSKAYREPGREGMPPPSVPPAPRLFAVYGDGRAEELLRADEATRLLEEAHANPAAMVVGGQPLGPQMEMCQSHCIFRVRVPDANVVPPPPSIALPEAGDGSPSLSSLQALPSLTSLPALTTAPPVTEFRQLVEYPQLTPDLRGNFRGSLKQYRQWEADTQAKRRAFMVPEPKGKKDAKGQKETKKEQREKKRSERRARKLANPDASSAGVAEARPEPAFVPELQLTPFDHLVQVLRARAGEAPVPGAAELLARAKSAQETEESQIEPHEEIAEDGNVEITSLTIAVDGSTPGPPSPAWDTQSPKGSPGGSSPTPPDVQLGDAWREAEAAGAAESSTCETTMRSAGAREASKPSKRPPAAETELSFSYFESDIGYQFLVDSGAFDEKPDEDLVNKMMSVKVDAKGGSSSLRAQQGPKRSPWNPRLVGEPSEAEEVTQQEPEPSGVAPASEASGQPSPSSQHGRAHFMDETPSSAPRDPAMSGSEERTFAPESRVPIMPEAHEASFGPHPSKKGANWDVYGEPRPQRPPVSQARVEINSAYMEIEGATDRRVRTSSIAHKKNAAKAPSVSAVRKTGQHAVGRGTEIGPQEILGDLGIVGGQEEYWKLTSSMQGLGNSNTLVEVTPGACRFGPLRLGAMYRMNIFVRNLDVDVTRFNVVPVESDYVRVIYTPGHLAPGMAAKIAVEIAALSPAKIEQLVEVKLKAHVVNVPVTARIFDAEEYDRLDAESLAINGRRIGRHRERDERNKNGPVQLIQDEAYCTKVMGKAYQKPPGDGLDPGAEGL